MSRRNKADAKLKTDYRGHDSRCHGLNVERMATCYKALGEQRSSYCHYNIREQALQSQRSVEASKQMLYGVFGNVVLMLEKYEQREFSKFRMEHKMPKYNTCTYIPDQRHKSFEDIKNTVETQLLLFETQIKACPPEALAEVHEELKRRTLSWSAVRAEMGITKIQQTDYYLSKLYEILTKGATTHRTTARHEVTEMLMKESFKAITNGDHDGADLNRQYQTYPDRSAAAPFTRSHEMLNDGASRISRARGDQELDRYLREDVYKFEKYGPVYVDLK